jgi:hypothetical protein
MPSSIGTSSCVTTNGPDCIMCPQALGSLHERSRYARERKIVLCKAPSIHCAPPGRLLCWMDGPISPRDIWVKKLHKVYTFPNHKTEYPLRIEFWAILNFQWQKSLKIQYGKIIKLNIPLRTEFWVVLNFQWQESLKIQYGKTIKLNIPLRIEFWVILNFQWQKSFKIQYLSYSRFENYETTLVHPYAARAFMGYQYKHTPIFYQIVFKKYI